MEFIDKSAISLFLNLGYAGCLKGKVGQARKLFEALLELKPDLRAAKAGLALSHIVVDDFAKGDEMLSSLMAEDPQDHDFVALLALSKALQKDADEVQRLCLQIPDDAKTASQLAMQAAQIVSQNR